MNTVTFGTRKNNAYKAGLPDGYFSNQKYQFVRNLEGLAMEDVMSV
jgi:hypothetical protein